MATLAEARLKACRIWPYGAHAILSLVPVESQRVDVMAVDQHWRLYYRPSELDKLPVDEAAGVILHEVSHLLLKHHRRAETILPANRTRADWVRWNIAADLAVNGNLAEEGVSLPKGGETPEAHGWERGKSAETYYWMLEDEEQAGQPQLDREQAGQREQDQEQSGGQPGGDQGGTQGEGEQSGQGSAGVKSASGHQAEGSGQPGNGDGDALPGGSCADGQQRPWELPGPDQCDTPGIKPHEAEIIIREVAEKIEQKHRGTGKGGWKGWAESVVNPKVDPRTKLLRAVRKAVEFVSGAGEYSYRRPNRRNPRPEMVLPSAVQPIPRVTVVVDTSGSMDRRDIGLSLGLIGKVLNGFRIRDGVRVICGDVAVQSAGRVFNPKQVELAGGGGTDMRVLIQGAAQAKPRPELIVVCTDGYTPWPEAPVGVPVVACVTRERTLGDVPAWIEAVELK